MFENLKHDLKRYNISENKANIVKAIVCLVFTQGVWAIVIYRFGAWVLEIKVPVISNLLKITYFLLNKLIEIVTGISIPANTKIGKGFYIGHFGQIFIHPDSEIGENCNISQGVTIGTRALGRKGVPKIGSNVYIGSGAKILGDIRMGDNIVVGANAVVIDDIPSNVTVVGVPARVIFKGKSKRG